MHLTTPRPPRCVGRCACGVCRATRPPPLPAPVLDVRGARLLDSILRVLKAPVTEN